MTERKLTPKQVADLFAQHIGAHPPCPNCKDGRISIVDVTVVEDYIERGFATRGKSLPTRERETLAAACNACEFIVEVRMR